MVKPVIDLRNISDLYTLLEEVKDPEIPVLSVVDLGVIREVIWDGGDLVRISITPTYTGCPAMDAISDDIRVAFKKRGLDVDIQTVISPPWSSDWISAKGRANLEEYGIAPPVESTSDKSFITGQQKSVPCPRCKSLNTKVISPFGSTACKALHQCNDCLEPFDYFKCI